MASRTVALHFAGPVPDNDEEEGEELSPSSLASDLRKLREIGKRANEATPLSEERSAFLSDDSETDGDLVEESFAHSTLLWLKGWRGIFITVVCALMVLLPIVHSRKSKYGLSEGSEGLSEGAEDIVPAAHDQPLLPDGSSAAVVTRQDGQEVAAAAAAAAAAAPGPRGDRSSSSSSFSDVGALLTTTTSTLGGSTSSTTLAPPSCGADEELLSGLCYIRCSLLTSGSHPVRWAHNACHKDAAEGLPADTQVKGLGCDGFNVGAGNGCPHAPGI